MKKTHPFVHPSKKQLQYCWWLKSCTTWDVWNPSPIKRYLSYQLVQDFFHQQYHFQIPKPLQLVGLTRFGPTEAEEKQQSEEGGRPVEEVRFRFFFRNGESPWKSPVFFFSVLCRDGYHLRSSWHLRVHRFQQETKFRAACKLKLWVGGCIYIYNYVDYPLKTNMANRKSPFFFGSCIFHVVVFPLSCSFFFFGCHVYECFQK